MPAVPDRPTWNLDGLDLVRRWLSDYEVGGMAPAALERLLGRCRDHGAGEIEITPAQSLCKKSSTAIA